jgi:hypothetical protein
VFEDHVDAPLAGDPANFVANFLGFMVDDVVGAENLAI